MKKSLPGIFANPINHAIDNIQESFYSVRQVPEILDENIEKKIDRIFSGKDFVYKSKVNIVTDEGVFEKIIVGKTNTSLLTMDNESIPFFKIKDIKKLG